MTRSDLLRLLSGYDVRDTQPVEVPPSILAAAAAMLAADAEQVESGKKLAASVAEFCSWLQATADDLDSEIAKGAQPSQGSIALTAALEKLRELVTGSPNTDGDPSAEDDLAMLKSRQRAEMTAVKLVRAALRKEPTP